MFVCKRSKAASDLEPCSASLSLTNGTIVKVNGKKVEMHLRAFGDFSQTQELCNYRLSIGGT
jgi:hypothetical protein